MRDRTLWVRLALALVVVWTLAAGPRADHPLRMAPLKGNPPIAGREGESAAPISEEESLSELASMRVTTVGGKFLSYCGNGSIDTPPATVRRLIIMIHGNDRGACGAARAVLAAGSPEQARETLVVAPRFPTTKDGINPATDLHWTFYSWSQGDPAENDDQPMSSYAAVDTLIERIPWVPRVVAGFSGGGQFVNRYAAGSSRDARFVIANPSSYLYFSSQRPGVSPAVIATCPEYDSYRYGLNDMNPYMRQSTSEELKRRYAHRQIVYLLGDADNDPLSSSMDKACGAKSQGANRFERGRNYWAYLPSVFGARITQTQSMHVIRGVGHDGARMMSAPAGRRALFG